MIHCFFLCVLTCIASTNCFNLCVQILTNTRRGDICVILVFFSYYCICVSLYVTKWVIKFCLNQCQIWHHSRQAHDVNITSPQRRCNVMTLHRRWGDVIFTSCARWVCIVLYQHWHQVHDMAKMQLTHNLINAFNLHLKSLNRAAYISLCTKSIYLSDKHTYI